jgi:hypothetical protein
MKNNHNSLRLAITGSIVAMSALLLSNCKSSEDPIAGTVSQVINNESTQDAQQDEVDDISTNSLGNTDSPSSREQSVFSFVDYRLACATVTRDTASFKTKGSGKITIDFGTGCTDKNGNVRAGKIMVAWSGGRWFNPGAVINITFSGYSINGVSFSDNDYRNVTNVSTIDLQLTFNVVANHSLTWPDNTTATRTVNKTREWIRTADIVDDKFIVSQTSAGTPAAAGTNRHGISYTVQITTPLEYDRSCAISNRVFKPVKGVKVITFDTNKVITIDFGDGTCDKTFTVTYDGKTKTFNGKNDSSND